MKAKILEIIATLDETNYIAALEWYYTLHDLAVTMAEKHNVPLFKVVGVISALSPMISFETNIKDAERMLTTRTIQGLSTYPMQRRKALMILEEAKNESEVMRILGGNKTKAFYQNILKPDSSKDVTVDSWMIKFFEFKNITPKRYRNASEIIQKEAAELSIQPHQLQALIWVGIRGKAF